MDIVRITDRTRVREILDSLRCPICKKLFRNAVTINICMHSFCKRCIKRKLIKEDNKSCPVCNVELGPKMSHYLRKDHGKQNILKNLMSHTPALKTANNNDDTSTEGDTTDEETSSQESTTNVPPPTSSRAQRASLDLPADLKFTMSDIKGEASSSSQPHKGKNKNRRSARG